MGGGGAGGYSNGFESNQYNNGMPPSNGGYRNMGGTGMGGGM